MHKESNSFRLSKILIVVIVASLSIITITPGYTTAQDIPEEIASQENPYKDAFFGSFDKDVKKSKTGKAVASVPSRIVGTPFKVLYGLGVTGKRTGHTIVYGTDEQKDSGSAIAGRIILSPFIYLGHLFTGAGTYAKENPAQAVLDAATLGGMGYGFRKPQMVKTQTGQVLALVVLKVEVIKPILFKRLV